MTSGRLLLEEGDSVRYTAEGKRATRPPSDAKGVVVEVEDYAITVRWPFGLAVELPDHIRKVTA